MLPAAAARGVGVVARSVLLQGVLTSRADHLPARLDPLRARSRQFRALLAAQPNPPTPAQAAIAFALAQPHIDAVLVGVRTRAELAENLAGLETRLPPPLLAELTRLRLDDPALLNPGNWRL